MPILTCSCGAALRYAEEKSGESLRCRACGAGAISPGSPSSVTRDAGQQAARQELPHRRPGNSTWPFLLFAVGPVVLLLGSGMTLLALYVCVPTPTSKVPAAKSQLRVVEVAIAEYRINNGDWPRNLEMLLDPDPHRDGRPYLREPRQILDPWGNVFLYEIPPDGSGPLLGFKTPNGQLITNQPKQLPDF